MHIVSGSIEMFPGESIRIVAAPIADGQELMGSAEASWTVDPPIAMVLREGTDGERAGGRDGSLARVSST